MFIKAAHSAVYRRTYRIIVFAVFLSHALEYGAAEVSHECVFRSGETQTSQNAVLFCKIRTIDSLERLLQNVTRKYHDEVTSLHVQCSEILFFESTLKVHSEKSSGRHAKLEKLKELFIDKCKIRQIPARAFENFKDLKSLRVITHNSEWSAMTMELNEFAFAGLNELTELVLSNNNIWRIKADTFCALYSLKTLNLSSNHFQNIKSLGFSEIGSEANLSLKSCNLVLEILDLSSNDLIVVTEQSLSKLRTLTTLSLQNNAISTLEQRAFGGLFNLLVLNLSNNFINIFSSDIFIDTKYLNEIYMSNNTITILPPGLFDGLNQLQILDISHNQLTSQWVNKDTFTGLLRMVILNLSYNKLSKINKLMFQDLYSLQMLNLEHNEIHYIEEHAFKGLRNLHSLTLSFNRITHIHMHLFTDLNVLHELFIDNNIIGHIDDNAFENMTTVGDLTLNDNKLSFIPQFVKKLRSLRSLDIGNNNISKINKEDFVGLSELFGLRLVDNKITHLEKDNFIHLPDLQVLNLASNKIKFVAKDCFRVNTNLKLLRMDGNEIESLDGIFNTLHNLIWLNMSDNQIPSFDFNSFPRSLEWLDLHKNKIITFTNSFSDLNIKLLDLSYNEICEIVTPSIPDYIEKLYLNNNNISYIQVGAFSKLKKISIVTLNNNNLERLETNALKLDQIENEKDLPEFFISGNPFICDCSMEWIQRANDLSHSRQYPRVLDLDKSFCTLIHSRAREKKKIIDMSSSDFLCPYESHCFALCHCCEFVACDCEMICPNNCKCYHDITWNSNVVDCSNANYDRVPDRIPMDASEIYLDGNPLSDLGNHAFIGKKKLHTLFLNNTGLKKINNYTFKGIESLKVLHLENNMLMELKGDEFTHLSNLNELYLDHNAIEYIADTTFSSLKSLYRLKIDDNKLVDFFPWKLLASTSKLSAHVSIEGNKYSCNCDSIVELDKWLRKDPGDPERMLCVDSAGNPTKITIASVLSHCKDYIGTISEPTVLKDHLNTKYMFVASSFFTLICSILMSIVITCLIVAVCYAFRYEARDWLYTKYSVPIFKSHSCTNIESFIDSNNYFDFYVICNTKDVNFIYHNVLLELQLRKFTSKNFSFDDACLNILMLENFSKSTKLSKRLIIVLTQHFVNYNLRDLHFKNILYEYLSSLNRSDINKIIILNIFDNNQKNDESIRFFSKFKNVSWNDHLFWEKFTTLINSTDTIITVKRSEQNVFEKTLRSTPMLRYTTMPVTNENYSKQLFTNSVQHCRKSNGDTSNVETSPSSDNTYGEGNTSNNSYMSIDNKTCPRFNYDIHMSPSCGHVYSKVDESCSTMPRSFLGGATKKGRTYFV